MQLRKLSKGILLSVNGCGGLLRGAPRELLILWGNPNIWEIMLSTLQNYMGSFGWFGAGLVSRIS
jgi:hypothetical protein